MRKRYVEFAAAGVFEQHVIALGLALVNGAQSDEAAHTMFRVHHVIARLEIEGLGGESGQMRLSTCRPRHQVRRLEQVF